MTTELDSSNARLTTVQESCGGRGTANVLVQHLSFTSAARCNLLEDEIEPLPVTENSIRVDFKPFEIITILLSNE